MAEHVRHDVGLEDDRGKYLTWRLAICIASLRGGRSPTWQSILPERTATLTLAVTGGVNALACREIPS